MKKIDKELLALQIALPILCLIGFALVAVLESWLVYMAYASFQRELYPLTFVFSIGALGLPAVLLIFFAVCESDEFI